MLSFQKLYEKLQNKTGDDSEGQLEIFQQDINDTNKIVCGLRPWIFMEHTGTRSTAASANNIQIPNKLRSVRSVIVTLSGGTIYRPKPVEDPAYWEYLQSLQAGTSDVTQRYMRQGDEVLLWPTPATAGSTVTFRGTKRLFDLSLADYTTGSIVSATNADETITGTGTSWTGRRPVGNQWIRIDYTSGDFEWYEVSSVTDDTHLELVKKYDGTTFAAATESYTMAEFSDIPAEYDNVLFYRPMALYYEGLENPTMAARYWNLYDGGYEAGQSKMVGGLIKTMTDNELQRNEGVYVEPLETEDLGIQDLSIPNTVEGESW